jgi:hypothetical protein
MYTAVINCMHLMPASAEYIPRMLIITGIMNLCALDSFVRKTNDGGGGGHDA